MGQHLPIVTLVKIIYTFIKDNVYNIVLVACFKIMITINVNFVLKFALDQFVNSNVIKVVNLIKHAINYVVLASIIHFLNKNVLIVQQTVNPVMVEHHKIV